MRAVRCGDMAGVTIRSHTVSHLPPTTRDPDCPPVPSRPPDSRKAAYGARLVLESRGGGCSLGRLLMVRSAPAPGASGRRPMYRGLPRRWEGGTRGMSGQPITVSRLPRNKLIIEYRLRRHGVTEPHTPYERGA